MKIYYTPHRSRNKEKEFFNYLAGNLPKLIHTTDKYLLPSNLLTETLNASDIISSLKRIKGLSALKRDACVTELERIPEKIRVIKSLEDISVDFTNEVNNRVFHIEFHESQHRIDSNKRMKNIYDFQGNAIPVPRYLQRLLRDIWRWKFLSNYKIVWFDWFEVNLLFPIVELISDRNSEYTLEGRFRISDF